MIPFIFVLFAGLRPGRRPTLPSAAK